MTNTANGGTSALPEYRALLDQIACDTGNAPEIVDRFLLPGITHWRPGHVLTRWEVPGFVVVGSAVFGGYIAMATDSMASHATYSIMNEDEVMLTESLSVDYKKPLKEGIIEATATAWRINERRIIATVIFSLPTGAEAAKGVVNQIVRPLHAVGNDHRN